MAKKAIFSNDIGLAKLEILSVESERNDDMPANANIRTDLAEETLSPDHPLPGRTKERPEGANADLYRLKIENREDAERLGKPIGSYVTVSFKKDDLMAGEVDGVVRLIAKEAARLIRELPGKIRSVFVAGLGNRHVTPDALGPLTVDRLPITRYEDCMIRLSALAPGVIGQTGIDCADLIAGWIKEDRPDLLIVIDALAAKSVDRLCCTVQLTDSGIVPGSGVGRHRNEISRRTMGIPVLAVGVPTVVDSATMLIDALEQAKIDSETNSAVGEMLGAYEPFFVTPTECDRLAVALADLLADSLTLALFDQLVASS